MILKADKRVRDTPFPLSGVPQKIQGNKHKIRREILGQIGSGSVITTSVSGRPMSPA